LNPGALALLLAAGLPPLLPQGPPQLADTARAFFDAEPVEGDLEGGLLLCRIDVVGDRGWDTFGAIDIAVTVTPGGRAPVEVWGPEDRSSAIVSVPAVTLRRGEKLKFLVEDRDLTEREFVARGAVGYAGLPLRLDLDHTQLECRGFSREGAEVRARAPLEKAALALAGVEGAEPVLTEASLGAPHGPLAEARSAALEAEAWLGGSDTSVQRLKARLKKSLHDFEERARASMRARHAALPPPGTSVPLRSLGLVARVVPGPGLTLEVAPAGVDVSFDDEDVAARTAFLAERGRLLELSATPAREGSPVAGLLKAGETRIVRLRVSGGANVPALARVDGELLRLR
jgi:hypothetical protein